MADVVEIILKLQQVRQFVSGAKQASGATADIGKAAEKSGKQAKVGWKGVAKWAGGAAAIYAGTKYLKGAVHSTEDLAKQTLRLSRVTGMSIETSSEWAQVLKARGMSTSTVEVAMVKLSREIDKTNKGNTKQTLTLAKLNTQYDAIAAAGGKKAPAALARLTTQMQRARDSGDKARKTFADLHVSSTALAKGNTQAVFNQVAQAMSKMHNPAKRLALAQQLFGRGARTLLPLLLKGRQGLQDQFNVVKKYGAQLGVHTVKELQDMISHQREMKIASEGMKVQLTTALLPVMMQLEGAFIGIVRAVQPFIRQGWVVKGLLAALTAIFITYKATMLVAAIAQNVFNVSLGFTALLIGAIPILLIALAVGFVYLYKRVGWFRDAVNATWAAVKLATTKMVAAFRVVFDWVKGNWKLLGAILLGPFALATLLIIRNLDKIKAAVQRVIDTIKSLLGKISGVADKLSHIPGAGLASKVFHGLAHGGTVLSGGTALIGERGPELLSLPTGARVTPLQGAGAPVGGVGFGGEVIIPVYLDGREVARSVARVTADRKARR